MLFFVVAISLQILEETSALGVPLTDASLLTSLSDGTFTSAQVFQVNDTQQFE